MRLHEATLLLWLTIVTAASANNFVSKHRVCDPTQNSWHPYTGVRIFNDVVYSSPVVVSDGDFSHLVEDPQFSASIVAVQCQDGEPTDAKKLWFVGWGNKEKIAGLASLSSMEAMWNREFCLLDFQKKETCYKVVRRRKYALRKLPLFRAGKIIGGLFQRHPETESEQGMGNSPLDDYEVIEDHDKKACNGCGKKSCSGKCKQPKKKKSGCGKCGKKGCSGKCKKKTPPAPAPVEPHDPCRGCGEKDCQKGECGQVPDTPCPGCNAPQCPGKCGKEPKQPCEGCNRKKCKGECGLIEDPIDIISPWPQPTTAYEPDWESWLPTTVPEPPIYSPAPGWPEVPQNESTTTAIDYVTVTETVSPSTSEVIASSDAPVSSETSTSEVPATSTSSEATTESPVAPTSTVEVPVMPAPSPPPEPRDSLKEDQPYHDDYDDDHYDDPYDDEPYYDDDDDYPPHYDDDDDYDYEDDDYDDDFDDPYHDGDQDLDFDHAPPIPDYPPSPPPPVDNDPVTIPKPCPDVNCGHKSCQRSRRVEIDIRINNAKSGIVRRDELPEGSMEDTVESAQWPYPIPYDHPYDNAYPWPHPAYPMGPRVGPRRSRARHAKNKHKSYPCDDTGCDNERCLRARRAIEIEIIRAHNASVFSAASQEDVFTAAETRFVNQNLLDLFKHFHPPCCEMDCGHDDCEKSRSRIELNIRIKEEGGNTTDDPFKTPCGINHPPVEDLLPQNLKCLFKKFHPPCKGSGCGGCNRIELDIRIKDNDTDSDNDTVADLEKRHALDDDPVVEAQLLDWFRTPAARSGRGRQIRETIVSQQEEIAKNAGLMDLHELFRQKHKQKFGEPCEEVDCGHDECDDMREDMYPKRPKHHRKPRPITRHNKGSSTIELDIRINENGTTVKRDLSALEGNNTMAGVNSTVVKKSDKARSQQARRRPLMRDRYPNTRSRYNNRGGYRRYGEDGNPLPMPPAAPPAPPQHPPHNGYPPHQDHPPVPPAPAPVPQKPYPYNPAPPQRPVDHPSEPLPGYPGNPGPRYPAPPVRYQPPPPPADNYPYPLPDNGPHPLPSQAPAPLPSAPTEPCNNRNCGHSHCSTLRRGLSIDIRINNNGTTGTTVNAAQFGSIGPIPLPNFLPVLPLIADNIMNSWVRVARNRVHLMMPLVHSADVLDVQYPQNNDMGWATKLSVNENYDFNVEARNMAEVMFDNALAKSMDTHQNLTSGEVLGVYSVAANADPSVPSEQSLDRVLQDIQVLSPIDQMVALLTQFQREMAPPLGVSQLEEARSKYKAAKVKAKQLANKLTPTY